MSDAMTPETLDDELLGRMTKDEFDSLAFGVIKLDAAERVAVFNAHEATHSRRSVGETIGLHFFEDVAPCTDVPKFRGRLASLRASGERTSTFDFRFRFDWGEQLVRVRFWIDAASEAWVFVSRLEESGEQAGSEERAAPS